MTNKETTMISISWRDIKRLNPVAWNALVEIWSESSRCSIRSASYSLRNCDGDAWACFFDLGNGRFKFTWSSSGETFIWNGSTWDDMGFE